MLQWGQGRREGSPLNHLARLTTTSRPLLIASSLFWVYSYLGNAHGKSRWHVSRPKFIYNIVFPSSQLTLKDSQEQSRIIKKSSHKESSHKWRIIYNYGEPSWNPSQAMQKCYIHLIIFLLLCSFYHNHVYKKKLLVCLGKWFYKLFCYHEH